MEKFEMLTNLFKDQETASKLLACTPEEGVAILKADYQLEFTEEELIEFANGFKAALAENNTDELAEDQLENVVGGGKSAAYYHGYYAGRVASIVVGVGILVWGW